MDDYQLVLSVGELMLKEKVITEFGFKLLHNDIESDMSSLSPNDHEKITRTAIYFTILYNMAVLFAGYCAEKEIVDPRSEKLKQIAEVIVQYIPKLLRGLEDKYLEVYHGAKVKAFEHGKLFDDYFPPHPEEQKLLDKMNGIVKDEDHIQTV
jgi:hypothetical protein